MRAIVTAALLTSLLLPASAQVVTEGETPTGPLILQLQAGTRALSMGGAYMITAPDADGIFYNPQLLSAARGFSVSTQRFGSAATLATFAAALDANFGFGVQVLDYELPMFHTAEAIGSPAALSRGGGLTASEAVAMLGYARTIKGVRLGVAGKWAHHWSGDYSAGAGAIDIGSSLNPLNWLMVALSVQNLGGDFSIGPSDYKLPMMGTLLVTQRPRATGPLDISLSGRVSAGPDVDAFGAVGADIGYWPFTGLTFAARAGLRFGTQTHRLNPIDSPVEQGMFTGGGGVTWQRVTLDYAWEPFQNADDSHRIGLRIR